MSTIREWGNPYTHEEHSRECIPNKPTGETLMGKPLTSEGHWVTSCNWCGQEPARLYRYDGDSHMFCNRECYLSYHL